MISKGIRGAITVEENSPEAIGAATIKLLTEMVRKNNIEIDSISHAIFTLTNDNELDVPNSLQKCLRVLIVINCGEGFVPEFVYLDGADVLRK